MGIAVLSLFDGMSCGQIALEKAGVEVDVYYASEIDCDAIAISQHNYPNIIHLGDIIKWREWSLPKIDLIIGGSPCQGFSRQGVGLNFNDHRSKLFFEFIDVVNYYKQENPELKFLLENVDMKKEWQDLITEYTGVNPIKINSCLFLPHNRPRTYWTDIKIEDTNQEKYSMFEYLDNVLLDDFNIVDGVKVDKSFSKDSTALISFVNGELRIKQAVKQGYIVAEKGDGINLSFPKSKTRRGRVTKNKSGCMDTSCDIGVYDQYEQIRKYTIDELEKLQGVPIGYTQSAALPVSKKVLGNGWTVDVIAHIFKGLK